MVDTRALRRTWPCRGPTPHRPLLRRLYVQVLIAIAAGILLGHFYPSLGVKMKPISDGFITLIRAVVPPIIFATVAVGIAKMGDMRRVGIVGLRAIIYFEIVSTLALFIGLAVGNLMQPGAGLHINPAIARRQGDRRLRRRRQIDDHRRFADQDDPAQSGRRRRRGRDPAGAGHGRAVRLRAVPYGRARPSGWCR